MLLTLALTAAAALGAAPQSPETPSLGLSAVRYYRAAGAQTVVDVFCRVPLAAVSPLTGEGSGAAFRIAVSVRDSTGLALVSQSWSEPVPAAILRMRGASTAEHLAFVAKPGRYTVEVTVTDSATGRVMRQQAAVEAFAGPPAASDLLLGTDIRLSAGGDSTTQSGELRKGSLIVQTSGEPVLTPLAAKLGYYLELYPQRAQSLSVAVRVLKASGEQVIATPPRAIALESGGGVTQGLIDLAGLPAGRYQLEVKATGAGTGAVTRTALFGMTGFETTATQAAVEAAQPADLFARATEMGLDELYQPLVYLMTSGEQGVYGTLTVEGKRNWLRQFWAKRDPTPGTPRNEQSESFYSRIGEANRRFREGGATAIPGWRTDRGRIFIRYGEADETLVRRQAGSTKAYEVWKFTRVRPLKYVFMDLTGFGNYSLIYTDDRREPSRPNWEELLGPEAVQDVQRF
jgi:GWxTD domain-containing protein